MHSDHDAGGRKEYRSWRPIIVYIHRRSTVPAMFYSVENSVDATVSLEVS